MYIILNYGLHVFNCKLRIAIIPNLKKKKKIHYRFKLWFTTAIATVKYYSIKIVRSGLYNDIVNSISVTSATFACILRFVL
jgi:hypothetical protein